MHEGQADAPFAAVLCHPHPLGGGTMDNNVVYRAMKAVNDPQWGLGWPVLRFNFRGVGLSHGVYNGHAEAEDVLTALAWVADECGRPPVLIGFSFGAAMAVAACSKPSPLRAPLRALAMLGLPLEIPAGFGEENSFPQQPGDSSYPFLRQCSVPKLFLSGASDAFAPSSRLEQVAASAAEPRRLVLLPHADHFFTGQLEAMQSALAGWLKETLL